jgi:hypothetical protein
MFDGDVDEIPSDDAGDQTGLNDHHLQMYCVDADDEPHEPRPAEIKPTPVVKPAQTVPSNAAQKLPNGKQKAVGSLKSSDVNRNVPGGKHISTS